MFGVWPGEENLLMLDEDKFHLENILIHEFGVAQPPVTRPPDLEKSASLHTKAFIGQR